MPQDDGVTLRRHLQSLAKQGEAEERRRLLNQPPLSPHVAHVWAWFNDIRPVPRSNGFSFEPLSRQEIQAWERDERIQLEGWERRAILRLDAEQRAAFAPKGKGGASNPSEAVEEV